ncbi:MAG: glycosyltransferase family 4 protein [Opitutaceae bacterium]
MKILFLTPGTGSYYCGACMRDNALARELQRAGHDVTIAPMYLPLMLDDTAHAGLEQAPVFFGGINIYLQQKLALFRKTPAFFDRYLNTTSLLRWAARHGHMTSARDHGDMTVEMLNVETSRFQKEWNKLLTWLEPAGRPDVVCLSNALLAGFAAPLKQHLGAPVVLFFQGEDSFLDGLPEPYRSQCWTALRDRLPDADVLLAPSRFYAGFMCGRLGLGSDAIEVVPNGIQLDGYGAAPHEPVCPTIGYLARMCREKGIELLVNAFIFLAGNLGDTVTRLKIAGAATAADQRLIDELKRRMARAGLEARVEWSPNLTREQKIAFLRGLTLFSVPATYAEAFGLYVIEAMACGIPVVQPNSASFPELILATGGGVCMRPNNPEALARGWQTLLADPDKRTRLGTTGRLSVEKSFSARTMCDHFCQVTERLTRATA